MFLGRIAPNKKQEDVIKTFYYYKKYMDPKARLFLVGSYEGMEIYYNALKLLVEQLDLEDVYFTGKVPFDQILAYYRVSDAFLCMSEHEGFCVPLIESMVFKVPIIAYNSSAIPYTLGDAGILINQKDYIAAAELLNKVIYDEQLRNRLIENGSRRLEHFSYERTAEEFRSYMKEILGEKA
jgi:glycosyltransferase involved in cell wall biosynthesis